MKNPLIKYFFLVALTLTISGHPQAQSLEKGKALYASGKNDVAEKELKLVQKNSSDYGPAQYYLGRIAYDKKEYDDATDYFKVAAEANPNNGDYFNWLGDAYAAVGGESGILTQMSVGPKALRAWEKATKLDSKNIKARVSLVGSYLVAPGFMGGGEVKAKAVAAEALSLLEEALRTTPENYLYHYWAGKVSAMTSLKLDFGEASLRKYLTHTPVGDEPLLAGAYMRLGQIKEKQGNRMEARQHYEMALKLDNKLKQAKEGLERTSK
jgi:tetratricopeptide (TPR) repeat protein